MVRLSRAAAGVAAALLLTGAAAPPASASGLEVSLDGSTWSRTLPAALFDELPVLVPGDSVTRTLHVRNASSTDALLRLDAVDVSIDNPRFAESLRLGASLQPDGAAQRRSAPPQPAVAVDGVEDCVTVLPSAPLPARGTASVVISLGFQENASMPSQHSAASLSLLLSASEDVGQDRAASACPVDGVQLPVLPLPDDGDAAVATTASAPTVLGLPLTGAAALPALATASGLLLLGFAAVLAAGRRKRSE